MSITVNDQEIDWQKWLGLEVTDENLFRDNLLEKKCITKRLIHL